MMNVDSDTAFAGMIDLARADYGSRVLHTTDDFFASCENLLNPAQPVFKEDEYTGHGKWMDGWESRRRRAPGHDTSIIALGLPGEIHAVDVDTSFFTGNYPPFASVEACWAPGATLSELRESVTWATIVPQFSLGPGCQNLSLVRHHGPWSHLRLHIYPAGGVARLRVWGMPVRPEGRIGVIDLAASSNGGRAVVCNDMYFSSMSNLIKPGESKNMGDGWETRRRRTEGFDWVVLALGQPAELSEAQILTTHFKGNYPERCSLDALYWPDAPPGRLGLDAPWRCIAADLPLGPHGRFVYPIESSATFSHVRLRIEPDGGIARLRLLGNPMPDGYVEADPLVKHLNTLEPAQLESALLRCCASRRWAAALAAAAPFVSRASLMGRAEQIWWHLDDSDWKEAFSGHPPIGGDISSLRERFAHSADWSAEEQSGTEGAEESVLASLAAQNELYAQKFGYIFIVCATGKSAGQMLSMVERRMENSPENEIRFAAAEQAQITAIRLEKLLAGDSAR